MSDQAGPAAPPEPVSVGRVATGLGGLLLALSLLMGWDAGLRDFFSPDQIDVVRRNGVLSAFDTEPSTPFQLLVPWGAALLGSAGVMGWVAARGEAGRAARVVIAGTALATLTFFVRQLFFDVPSGVPIGSVVGNFGAFLAVAGVLQVPVAEEEHPPSWTVLALGVLGMVILTGMVHDAYDVVTYAKDFFGLDVNTSSWPESWLVDGVGARTNVDVGLIAVGTLALLACLLAVRGRLPDAAAKALAGLAGLVLLALMVVAIGPNPGISGVDRFPVGLLAAAALLATIGTALRLTLPEPVPAAEPEPERPAEAAPVVEQDWGPMPPDHVWARPGSPESLRTAPAAPRPFDPGAGWEPPGS